MNTTVAPDCESGYWLSPMGRKSQDHRRIELRLKAIEDRMAELSLEKETLTYEQEELRTALKVLSRLHSTDAGDPPSSTAPEVEADVEIEPEEELAVGEPVTTGEMALVLLTEAGPAGMTSPEILAAIQKRWRPSLVRTSLSPPLSRLKDRGKIDLVGEQWKLITDNDPPDRSGGSETGGGLAIPAPASSKGNA